MQSKSKMITLPCDCKCCMFVIEKTQWEDGEISYCITVQDSRYDHNINTLWGRLKRAAIALFGKPVYYNDVHLEGKDRFEQFLREMQDLAEPELLSDEEK